MRAACLPAPRLRQAGAPHFKDEKKADEVFVRLTNMGERLRTERDNTTMMGMA